MAKMFTRRFTHWLSHIEAHHRLAISLAVATLFFLASHGHLPWRTRLISTWDAYALSMLAMTWTRIYKAEPRVVVRLAKLGQLSRNLIFVFVMVAACSSLAAVAVPNVKVTLAADVAAGGFVPPAAPAGAPGRGPQYSDLPAFCRVAATVKTAGEVPVKIEVWLPAAGWNGAFRGVG